MKYSALLLFLMVAFAAQSQKETASFRVEGICGMCEERIEGALDVPGVVVADWDKETKLLQVVYQTKKLSEDDLHALIHAVGHDTAAGKATDEQYAGLHGCCKYREGASCPSE